MEGEPTTFSEATLHKEASLFHSLGGPRGGHHRIPLVSGGNPLVVLLC